MDCVWKTGKNTDVALLWEDPIKGFLASRLFVQYSIATDTNEGRMLDIPFFTEYERNGFVYRAHPKYRGENPYYDWAFISWVTGTDITTGLDKTESVIGRILCFITHPNGELMALIHSCKQGTDEQHGVYRTYWHLECEGPAHQRSPQVHMVNVECMLEHACMIPYSKNDPFRWIHIWHPSKWPACFQTIEPPVEDNL